MNKLADERKRLNKELLQFAASGKAVYDLDRTIPSAQKFFKTAKHYHSMKAIVDKVTLGGHYNDVKCYFTNGFADTAVITVSAALTLDKDIDLVHGDVFVNPQTGKKTQLLKGSKVLAPGMGHQRMGFNVALYSTAHHPVYELVKRVKRVKVRDSTGKVVDVKKVYYIGLPKKFKGTSLRLWIDMVKFRVLVGHANSYYEAAALFAMQFQTEQEALMKKVDEDTNRRTFIMEFHGDQAEVAAKKQMAMMRFLSRPLAVNPPSAAAPDESALPRDDMKEEDDMDQEDDTPPPPTPVKSEPTILNPTQAASAFHPPQPDAAQPGQADDDMLNFLNGLLNGATVNLELEATPPDLNAIKQVISEYVNTSAPREISVDMEEQFTSDKTYEDFDASRFIIMPNDLNNLYAADTRQRVASLSVTTGADGVKTEEIWFDAKYFKDEEEADYALVNIQTLWEFKQLTNEAVSQVNLRGIPYLQICNVPNWYLTHVLKEAFQLNNPWYNQTYTDWINYITKELLNPGPTLDKKQLIQMYHTWYTQVEVPRLNQLLKEANGMLHLGVVPGEAVAAQQHQIVNE